MKSALVPCILMASFLHAQSTQNPCTSNLGGDVDPSFIEIRINSTSFSHQTFSSPSVFYHEYPASGNTTATLAAGQSYQMYTSTSSEAVIGMWLDTNQNNIFEAQEYKQLVNSMSTQNTTSFTVPASAANGNTRMRIRSRAYGSTIGSANACSSFGSGETRDYMVNISGTQLGTKETPADSHTEIYPNPTADLLHIHDRELILSLEVYNTEGRKIKSQIVNKSNAAVDLSGYVPGEYLVKVLTRTDNRIFKVLKK